MPEMKLDSFDWDLWLRDHDKDYMTLEDEDKLVSQPSIDESNATWWNNMYYDYKKSGGELNFKQFQDMLKREGDIGDLGGVFPAPPGLPSMYPPPPEPPVPPAPGLPPPGP